MKKPPGGGEGMVLGGEKAGRAVSSGHIVVNAILVSLPNPPPPGFVVVTLRADCLIGGQDASLLVQLPNGQRWFYRPVGGGNSRNWRPIEA